MKRSPFCNSNRSYKSLMHSMPEEGKHGSAGSLRRFFMSRLLLVSLSAFTVCAGGTFGAFRAFPAHAAAAGSLPGGRNKTAFPTQGIYEISSAVDAGFVLDIRHSALSGEDAQAGDAQADTAQKIVSEEVLQLHRPLQVRQQEFYLEYVSSRRCHIVSLLSGEYLAEGEPAEASDSAEAASAAVILVSPDLVSGASENAGSDDGVILWDLVKRPDGTFLICSKHGLYLTLSSGNVYNGSTVVLAPFTGDRNQKWQFSPAPIYSEGRVATDHVNPYEADGKLADTEVTIVFDGSRVSISSEELASWMISSEDSEDAGSNGWLLDETKITDFVHGLSERYNRIGRPQKFTTSYGTDVTIYGGEFGWKLDEEAMCSRIKKAISMEGHRSIFPVWAQHGGDYNGINTDIGDSYVEICLTGQKVWLYKDGKRLMETDCVSGTANTGRETPGGVYYIYYKQSPATLTGADYSSYVNYWMPFVGNIGLHDAPWRGSFGGDIYLTSGSHGCVNLPYEAAKLLYETTRKGYPVVCYH